jgi:hypothetical protein
MAKGPVTRLEAWLLGGALVGSVLLAISAKHEMPQQGVPRAQEKSVAAVAQLQRRMAYAQARDILLAGGWRPARFPRQTAEIRCPAERDVCLIYPETSSCSDSGMLHCRFAFRDSRDKELVVVTIHEQADRLAVDSWWLVEQQSDAMR